MRDGDYKLTLITYISEVEQLEMHECNTYLQHKKKHIVSLFNGINLCYNSKELKKNTLSNAIVNNCYTFVSDYVSRK